MTIRLIIAVLFGLATLIPSSLIAQNIVNVQQAATRHEQMSAMMETNPAKFLQLAITKEARSKLSRQVQAWVEQEIKVTGTLEIFHEDWPDEAKYYWFLKNGPKTYSLYIAGDMGEFYSGVKVEIKGVLLGNKVAAYAGDIKEVSAPLILPNTFGQQKTIVILVTFQNNPITPYTTQFATDVVFSGSKSVSNYFLENSYQQTSLTGDVFGWFTIAQDNTVCELTKMENLAIQAASAVGVNMSAYNRRVYAFPRNACPWGGAAFVGGNPSKAWINDNMNLRVVAHELGHGFGLLHSHSLDCGATTLGDNCQSIEYGDTHDVMGSSFYHFNAFQKEYLGWLNYGVSPPIKVVSQSGISSVGVYEKTDQNPKALKFVRLIDQVSKVKTWYYLESRKAVGFDAGLSANPNVLNGALVRIGTDGNTNSSYLLDMTPSTDFVPDQALEKGVPFVDQKANISMSVTSVNSEGATMTIAFNAAPLAPANVSVQ